MGMTGSPFKSSKGYFQTNKYVHIKEINSKLPGSQKGTFTE